MKKLAILGMVALSGVASADVLFDNGPVVNARGRSVLLPNYTGAADLGFGDQTSAGNAVADDFTVSSGTWNVKDIDFYGYQTGATSFGFTDVTWSIVSGSITGAVVASGTTAVTDGGVVGYRVTGTTLGNKDRAIYDIKADIPDVSLAAGSYWLTWSINGSSAFSGPWQPPTSDRRAGDAMQSIGGGAFAPLLDEGNGATVDLPFALNGTVSAVPEPSTLASLAAGLGLLGVMRRRRKQ
jgi:hypothetical protein